MSDSVRLQRQQPTRLPCPWDSPGKNTGVGCHFLLQCMKVKSENEVTQSCLTLGNLMDCSPPGSSVHEVFRASIDTSKWHPETSPHDHDCDTSGCPQPVFDGVVTSPDNMGCPRFSPCCLTEIDVPIDLRWVSQGISGLL